MTGKELKAWAAQIPDGATIEQVENKGYSYEKWTPLDATTVRAMLLITTYPNIPKETTSEDQSHD